MKKMEKQKNATNYLGECKPKNFKLSTKHSLLGMHSKRAMVIFFLILLNICCVTLGEKGVSDDLIKK